MQIRTCGCGEGDRIATAQLSLLRSLVGLRLLKRRRKDKW